MTNPPLGVVLRHLRIMVDAGGVASQTDGQLLERFTARRDETAFATLLRRHGPMVLGVCRRVLPRVQDAEDVFQATFLLLARKAGSIRKHESVGSWLHGVAYRLAMAAKTQAVCRRAHERLAGTMRKTENLADATWQELQAVLDEGLQRLPEKYRTALVLAYLEGKTHEEAATQLGCPLATFRNWVARGRQRLRKQLLGRGLTLFSASLATALAENAAPAAVPAALLQPTLRSATLFASGTQAAVLVSRPVAALVEGGLKAMLVTQLQLPAVLLVTFGILTAAVGLGAQSGLFARTASEDPAKPPAQSAGRPLDHAASRVRIDAFGDPLPEGAIERLGTLRFRQGGGPISRLLVTPGGKTLISTSLHGSRMVCVWELATGKLVRQFRGHYDENGAVALSPDGTQLAIGRETGIYFYDLASGRELRQLTSPLGNTEGLAFAPDGRTLASGHGRQTVILWDLSSTGRELGRLEATHNRLTLLNFSPDSETLATGNSLDRTIRLFDVPSRQQRLQLSRGGDRCDFAFSRTALAFSPADSSLAIALQGGTVIAIVDAVTGQVLRELRGAGKYIQAAAWSPDGKTLAASYHDMKSDGGSIHFWDATTGKKRRTVPTPGENVHSLVFSPDGRTLISGGGNSVIRLWDIATGQERVPANSLGTSGTDAKGDASWVRGLPAPIACLGQSPDGRTVAFGDGVTIRLWDRMARRQLGVIPGGSFAFTPDGTTLAVCGHGIALWNVADRRLLRRLSTDPKKEDGSPWVGYDRPVISPDGKVLATIGQITRSRGGSNVTDEVMVQLWDLPTGNKLRRLSMKERANGYCSLDAVVFSADGKKLIASGQAHSADKWLLDIQVRVWEVATGKHLVGLSTAMAEALENAPAVQAGDTPEKPLVYPRVVASPDGKLLAMNGAAKTIPVWDATTGRLRLHLEGHEDSTVCVAFSPDGHTLASSGWDNTIRLWDLETGKELRRLSGHRGKAEALLFATDGKTLISAGGDTTILFWDVAAITKRGRKKREQDS
jgi:RNA polymerase sigma factor (sigma-70 family)